MIIHIAGPSGSGKTTLGKRLKEHYKDKVIVKDLDDLLWKEFIPWQEKTDITAADFFANFELNYQEYIDNFIKKNKGKPIIFVGINTFIMNEMQQFKGVDRHFPKAFFDLRADHKYYIDIPVEQVMKQKFYRMMDDFCNSKDIIFSDLLENEKKTRKNIMDDIMRQTHIKEVRIQTEKWNKFYKDKGYEYLSNDEIYKKISSLLDKIVNKNGGKYYNKYMKYKIKYLNIKGGNNNKLFAQHLANFMKENNISNKDYAIIAGYCVAQLTKRSVTDLDVIVSKDAYEKLSEVLLHGSAEITKTNKLFLETPYGEIEFFERENTGFPSKQFSLTNLQKNNMLNYDDFNNPYLNTKATILHYSDVKKINGKLFIGDNHEISQERLRKNISHLTAINNIIKDTELTEKIKYLEELV